MEAATQSMEDSGVLNAGQGCYLTEEGTVELDAMIMDGQTLNTGKFIMVFCLYYNRSRRKTVDGWQRSTLKGVLRVKI